jgi:hypothetical protein
MRDFGLASYSLLVIWGAGYLLIRRFRLFRDQPPVFVCGASFGIGGGVVGLVLLVSATLTGTLSLLPGYLVLLAAGLTGARSIRTKGLRTTAGSSARRLGIAEFFLLVLLGTIVLAMVGSGSFGALAGDGWAIWAFKARAFFLDRRVDPAFLRDEAHYGFAHLDYPLLLPLLEWWVFRHLGHLNESAIRLVHVGFYVSLLAAFCGSLRPYIGRAAALLCTVLLALLGPGVGNVLDGYADLVQGYYALLGFVSFVEWARGGRTGELASAGLSLSLGTHVKAEGLSWLAVVAAAALLAAGRSPGKSTHRRRALWTFAAIALPLAGLWPLYRWVFDVRVWPVVQWPSRDLLASRLPLLLEALGVEFGLRGIWDYGWGPLWAVTVLGCMRAVTYKGSGRGPILTCWSPLLTQGLIVFGFYLLTVAPLKWHLQTSLTRLLLQCAPACLWASAATLLPAVPFTPHDGDEPARG